VRRDSKARIPLAGMERAGTHASLSSRTRVGAGGEAAISRLKHTFDMHRPRYRGPKEAARCAYWAAISNNLVAIVRRGD
jgi:hypothetical protein